MAVLSRLRGFWYAFAIERSRHDAAAIPYIPSQPPTSMAEYAADYDIRLLTIKNLDELDALDRRCFTNGEAYTRHTLEYLLNQPNSLSYRVVLPKTGTMVAFIIAMLEEDGTGHITTLGVSPEHRRRGLAFRLLERAENAFQKRNVRIMRLEVRTNNFGAQQLYTRAGYSITQRINAYYANGGDGFLMVKSLV